MVVHGVIFDDMLILYWFVFTLTVCWELCVHIKWVVTLVLCLLVYWHDDDVVLLAPTAQAMRGMLLICEMYYREWFAKKTIV